ncbi:hypothetical protein NQZ68_021770, partial [Dissostichus eleginoides]
MAASGRTCLKCSALRLSRPTGWALSPAPYGEPHQAQLLSPYVHTPTPRQQPFSFPHRQQVWVSSAVSALCPFLNSPTIPLHSLLSIPFLVPTYHLRPLGLSLPHGFQKLFERCKYACDSASWTLLLSECKLSSSAPPQ